LEERRENKPTDTVKNLHFTSLHYSSLCRKFSNGRCTARKKYNFYNYLVRYSYLLRNEGKQQKRNTFSGKRRHTIHMVKRGRTVMKRFISLSCHQASSSEAEDGVWGEKNMRLSLFKYSWYEHYDNEEWT
jgi:hypothetical protein